LALALLVTTVFMSMGLPNLLFLEQSMYSSVLSFLVTKIEEIGKQDDKNYTNHYSDDSSQTHS